MKKNNNNTFSLGDKIVDFYCVHFLGIKPLCPFLQPQGSCQLLVCCLSTPNSPSLPPLDNGLSCFPFDCWHDGSNLCQQRELERHGRRKGFPSWFQCACLPGFSSAHLVQHAQFLRLPAPAAQVASPVSSACDVVASPASGSCSALYPAAHSFLQHRPQWFYSKVSLVRYLPQYLEGGFMANSKGRILASFTSMALQ